MVKLSICIAIVEIWSGIANGQIWSIFDGIICLRHDNSGYYEGPAKKFCHWVWITSVLHFIKHIFITNLQNIPPLLKHILGTFLPSCEKQINSLLLVSVGDTDK